MTDIQTIKNNCNIVEVIGRDFELKQCGGYYKAVEHDSLVVDPKRQAFWWNSRSLQGDVIGWLMDYHGLAFKEAIRVLDDGVSVVQLFTDNKQLNNSVAKRVSGSPQGDWQERAAKIVMECHDILFSSQGQAARQWLNERGLNDETLRYFKVGLNPVERRISSFWVWNGVIIPHIIGGQLWGVKVRLGQQSRAKKKDKYLWLKGSNAKTIFNADTIGKGKTVLATEGEFDCMLMWQEVRDIMPVITLGSASNGVPSAFRSYLLGIKQFLACYDDDPAGRDGLQKWRDYGGKRVEIVNVPNPQQRNKYDVTDFYKDGGDLRQWVSGLISCSKSGLSLTESVHGSGGDERTIIRAAPSAAIQAKNRAVLVEFSRAIDQFEQRFTQPHCPSCGHDTIKLDDLDFGLVCGDCGYSWLDGRMIEALAQ